MLIHNAFLKDDWGGVAKITLQLQEMSGNVSREEIVATIDFIQMIHKLWHEYLSTTDDADLSHLADMGITTRDQALDFIENDVGFGGKFRAEGFEVEFYRKGRYWSINRPDKSEDEDE